MHIPIYVYIIFFVLVYIGIHRCFPRVIRLQRLFIAPLFFIIISIRGMLTLFDMQYDHLLFWISGCLIGMYLGYMHVKGNQIKADHQQQLIQLPGDWSMLCLILAIFAFEFFIHYTIAAQWEIRSTFLFKLTSLVILGIIAGMSSGRTLNYFLKYKNSVSKPLVLKS